VTELLAGESAIYAKLARSWLSRRSKGRSWRDENIYREIVGVIDNVRSFGAGVEVRGVAYVPHRQVTWRGMADQPRDVRRVDPMEAMRPD
jgi:hypothetical protein